MARTVRGGSHTAKGYPDILNASISHFNRNRDAYQREVLRLTFPSFQVDAFVIHFDFGHGHHTQKFAGLQHCLGHDVTLRSHEKFFQSQCPIAA